MPNPGDSFEIVLKDVHLNWGTVSREGDRNRHIHEAYIPIPLSEARRLDIAQGSIFTARSADGTFSHPLIAAGSQGPNNEYGKNFETKGGLRILGKWLKDQQNAEPGDKVKVEWDKKGEIILTVIK